MQERAHDHMSYRQGIDAVVRLLGGQGTSWVPAVLAALATQRRRRSDLLDTVNQSEARCSDGDHRMLSPKVFEQTVRRMVRDGLLTREQTQVFPTATWYELTPLAHSLLAALRPVAEWAQSNIDHAQSQATEDNSA